MAEATAAEAYETHLVPNIFGPWVAAVLGQHRLAPGARVLDVACGTGIAARLAACAVGRQGAVVATDIDAGMLDVARRATAAAEAAPIDWQRADALALPFPDASFDVVLCFEGIQFFPDRARGIAEFRRVLKPRGRLLGTVWGALQANAGYAAIAEGLAKFVSPDAARLPPFMLHDADVIRSLLETAGFVQIDVVPRTIVRSVPSVRDFIDWVAAGAPTTRLKLAQLAAEDRESFAGFVAARLAPLQRDGHVQMPYMRHVLSAAAP